MNAFEFRAMSTEIKLVAEGNPGAVAEGFKAVSTWIHSCEQRFTRFSDTSELADLNRSDGRWVPVSQDLFEILTEAYKLVDQTNGLFDPSILPELIRTGYDRSIEQIRDQEIKRKISFISDKNRTSSGPSNHRISFSLARLEVKNRSVHLQPGMKLDLGGIAKGWIAEKAAYKLAAYADCAIVDIGGDLFVTGEPKDKPFWDIGLEDPLDPSIDLAVLHVKGPVAVATSSIVKRHWQQSTIQRHHIIDPRTGEPAVTDWLCVTAIAPHGAQAEAFAKALLIAGSRGAGEVSQGLPQLSYIAVDQNRTLWGSENSSEFLYATEKI